MSIKIGKCNRLANTRHTEGLCHGFHSRFEREHAETELSSSTHLTILRRELTRSRPKRGTQLELTDSLIRQYINRTSSRFFVHVSEKIHAGKIRETNTDAVAKLLLALYPAGRSVFRRENATGYKCLRIQTRRSARKCHHPRAIDSCSPVTTVITTVITKNSTVLFLSVTRDHFFKHSLILSFASKNSLIQQLFFFSKIRDNFQKHPLNDCSSFL